MINARKSLTLLVWALTLMPAPAHAQELLNDRIPPPPNTSVASIPVAVCQAPPKIDGVLDDPCWKTATHAAGFYRYLGTTPVSEQTEAWICADSRHLYVAFHCLDDHPQMIKAMEMLRNGDISHDDSVSIEIDSENTRRNVSQFSVSARGVQTESLEGGTADNITWAGDWKAVTKRVPDGWTCEMAIPFALLRYSRNTHAMGIILMRKLARETSSECWPYMSRDGQQHMIQALTTFTGLAPTDYKPQPVFLPYALATGGDGYAGRFGMDVKYPLTTAITGLATLNPDFQDVEQAVQSIAFSYDPIYYNDNRPFFAEGSNFLPYQDVFYSLAIGQIDEGVKVAGKQGGTTLNFLGTNSAENGGRSDVVANMTQEIGNLSDVHVAMAQDSEYGIPGTRVIKGEGVLGWQTGQTQYSITANHMPSWIDNQISGAKDYATVQANAPLGKPGYYLAYNDIGPNFLNNIGAIPETNIRGTEWTAQQQNNFDTGGLDTYYVEMGGSYYDYHTGGFFRRNVFFFGYLDYRSGWNIAFDNSEGLRYQDELTDSGIPALTTNTTTSLFPTGVFPPAYPSDSDDAVWYRDHLNELTINWATHTLFGKGGVDETYGTQDDQRYSLLAVYQGIGLKKNCGLTANFNQSLLGNVITTQTVLSGTYRFDSERDIGLRAVSLDHDVDFFLSYEQKPRHGDDIFIILGNPNSPSTAGLVTVKVVHPF